MSMNNNRQQYNNRPGYNRGHTSYNNRNNNDRAVDVVERTEEENQLLENWISYKNPDLLFKYLTEIYKITPRRFNGLSSMQQRTLRKHVSLAQFLAIIPKVPPKKKC